VYKKPYTAADWVGRDAPFPWTAGNYAWRKNPCFFRSSGQGTGFFFNQTGKNTVNTLLLMPHKHPIYPSVSGGKTFGYGFLEEIQAASSPAKIPEKKNLAFFAKKNSGCSGVLGPACE
jgi:hypothetical protein